MRPFSTSSLSAAADRVLLLAALLAGCSTTPTSLDPRPSRPLTGEDQGRYSVATIERERVDSTRVEDGVEITKGHLTIEGRELEFSTWTPVGRKDPAPFVDILPILAGGDSLVRSLGMDLAEHGFASGTLERPGRTLRDHESIEQLGANWTAIVRHERAFLGWALARPGVDPEGAGCVGLSLGGLFATVVTAVDPRVCWSAICIAGGDLPDILIHSNEIRARRWGGEQLASHDGSPRKLQTALREGLGVEPARLALSIDPSKILFVRAAFDHTMPGRNSALLWECLGRPERITLPTEHYTSALFLSWITGRIVHFARARTGVAEPAREEG
jgi:dienelactone hydrolase